MWRPTLTILRKVILSHSLKENIFSKILYSTKAKPRSTAKLTLISTSVGVLFGAAYGGYTHYKVNVTKVSNASGITLLKEAPEYKAHYKVLNESDTSNLELILFQYRTCPFCCKVRTYLDAKGISYEVVEVDAVLRQAMKWTDYKKVPIVLAKVEDGYQQLRDSTAIISVLETYLQNKDLNLGDTMHYYPVYFFNESGKELSDVVNKYSVMHNNSNESKNKLELEEREWREWADAVLVHTLSPNVYRTAGEAIETFKWFKEVGGWGDSFPAWEVALMVYGGAAAMWVISKRLKKRHNIKDDERLSLYDAANLWMGTLQRKGTKYLGGDQPNLADISVFGVLSSIEGCRAFQDLRENTSVGDWFDNMKKHLDTTRGRVIPLIA